MGEQVLELLAQGLGKQGVLDSLGLTSQQFDAILAVDGFSTRLAARAQEVTAARVELRYSKLEDKVLKHIDSHLDEYDAQGLCKILETASRQRVANGNGGSAGHFTNPTANKDVILILPVNMSSQQIVKNDRNEVVAIGDRNMGSLPIEGVRALFSRFKDKAVNTVDMENGDDRDTDDRDGERNDQINQQGDTYETASAA